MASIDDRYAAINERNRKIRDDQRIEAERKAKLGNLDPLNLETPQWIKDMDTVSIDGVDDMSWEDSQAALVGGSEFENIEGDPRLRDEQMASLGALQELANNGGMNAQDQANLARIQSQASQADRGRREAILQNAAQRGMGGSGMELLAQLDSSQAATDRQAQEGLDVAGMAQDRALQAMMQGGNLAGNIRGQDHGEDSQRAAAMDAISKFNAGTTTSNNQFNTSGAYGAQQDTATNTLNTQKTNADFKQASNAINTQGRQEVANNSADIKNDEARANTITIPQQNFQNATGISDKAALTEKEAADARQRKRDRENASSAQAAQAGVAIAAAMSDERAKKDVKDVNKLDMDDFLATIQPKNYKYKDEKHGKGDFTGIIAQDLLKSKLGADAVVQVEDDKMGYDKDKMQGIILAALKHLDNKISKKG